MDVNQQAEKLADLYAQWGPGLAPGAAQWARILSLPQSEPVTLVNLFKVRGQALYPNKEFAGTGEEAFQRYAAVSMPTMTRVGGEFLLVGAFHGSFIGADEDWDVVAIGRYPNLDALIALYEDKDYVECFLHRAAACERQKVFTCR